MMTSNAHKTLILTLVSSLLWMGLVTGCNDTKDGASASALKSADARSIACAKDAAKALPTLNRGILDCDGSAADASPSLQTWFNQGDGFVIGTVAAIRPAVDKA